MCYNVGIFCHYEGIDEKTKIEDIMIKFIYDTSKAHEIFYYQALNNDDAIFAPNIIHAGPMTIEGYLAYAKQDFQLDEYRKVLDLLEITNTSALLSSLSYDQQMLIHYFSHLIIDRSSIILELPTTPLSSYFCKIFCKLVELTDYEHRTITIITDNKLITDHDFRSKTNKLKTYTFKPSSLTILYQLVGRKFVILGSLFITVAILILSMALDQQLVSSNANYISIPADMIAISNQSSNCEFNGYSYGINLEQCQKQAPISYEQLDEILSSEPVEAVYFDNKAHASKLEQAITAGQRPTVGTPKVIAKMNLTNVDIPCINDEQQPQNIICAGYTAETSLFSVADTKDRTELSENITSSLDEAPNYILIKADNPAFVAANLASQYPSINIYTKFTAERYLIHSNNTVIFNLLALGSFSFLVIIASFLYLLNYLGMTIRGLKYRLIFQTGNPKCINKIYYFSQILYFGTLTCLITLIAGNLNSSFASIILSTYFGCLIAVIWIYLGQIFAAKYRIPEKELLADIKRFKKADSNRNK